MGTLLKDRDFRAGLWVPLSQRGVIRLSSIGDSLGENARQVTTTYQRWVSDGWLTPFRQFAGHKVDLPVSRLYNIGGRTTTEVISEIVSGRNNELPQLTNAIADNSDGVILRCGVNDVTLDQAGTLGATTIANYQAIYDALFGAGKFVVHVLIRMRGGPTGGTWSTAQMQTAQLINRWVINNARGNPRILVVDPNPVAIDYATGWAKAGYLYDLTHDTVASAYTDAKAIWDQLGWARFTPPEMANLLDVYDATYNPGGNLLTNGLLAGTSGTISNGVTGNAPTSWQQRWQGTTTATCAGSQVSDATGTNKTKYQLAIGGTADANAVANLIQTVSAGVVAGATYQAEIKLDFDISAGGFVPEFWAQCRDAGNTSLYTAQDGIQRSGYGVITMPSGALLLKTDPFVAPTGTTQIRVEFDLRHPASGSLNETIQVSAAALRRLA